MRCNSRNLFHSHLIRILTFSLPFIYPVLKQNPNDVDALHCKVITLIKLEKYQNALDIVVKHFAEDQLIFERGYCLYRLNRWAEVLEITTKFNTSGKGDLGHLKAQAVSSKHSEDDLKDFGWRARKKAY